MKPKHQVFVSSTYSDLQEEREAVASTLLKLGAIPAGMEQFPASSQDPWSLIEEYIDGCDYFVLIVAGRYGSTDPSGQSYTEREYRYAKKRELPTLAFLRKTLGDLSQSEGDLETDPTAMERLTAFRESVMEDLHCNFFDTPAELSANLATSLPKMIEKNPRDGWVRADAENRFLQRAKAADQSFRERIREVPQEWIEEIRGVVETSGVLTKSKFSVCELANLGVLEERIPVSESEGRFVVASGARYFVKQRLRYMDLRRRRERHRDTKSVMLYERARRPVREIVQRINQLVSPYWWETPTRAKREEAEELCAELEEEAEKFLAQKELLEGDHEALRSVIAGIRRQFRGGWPLSEWPEETISMWLAEWNEEFDGWWPGDHLDDYDPAEDYWLGLSEAEISHNLSRASTWGSKPDSLEERTARYQRFLKKLDKKAEEVSQLGESDS